MSIDFSKVTNLEIPEGVVTEIKDSLGRVIWAVSGGKAVLMVEKITSNTYAGETQYTGETFILLDIYPKTKGTVSVTYGGLTKTITDTSGAAEPNAQRVFFGTFNGVSDSVTTPASGELTIEGDYYAFGCGSFAISMASKSGALNGYYSGVTAVDSFGNIEIIPANAFYKCDLLTEIKLSNKIVNIGEYAFAVTNVDYVEIPRSVLEIGTHAFNGVKTAKVLPTTPPTLVRDPMFDMFTNFGTVVLSDGTPNTSIELEQIIVPNGCGNTYKTAEGWSTYADYIVEAS